MSNEHPCSETVFKENNEPPPPPVRRPYVSVIRGVMIIVREMWERECQEREANAQAQEVISDLRDRLASGNALSIAPSMAQLSGGGGSGRLSMNVGGGWGGVWEWAFLPGLSQGLGTLLL